MFRQMLKPAWARANGLLSLPGVERAAVGAVAALKAMNLFQAALGLRFGLGAARRPWLEVAALLVLALSGAVVVGTGWQARRLVRRAVAFDVAIAVIILVTAPWFQPTDHVTLWTDWPIAATFLVGAEAAVCFKLLQATASTLVIMAAALSWLFASPPPVMRAELTNSPIPYVGFSLVSGTFLFYLRRLAKLADARAATIHRLEEERTRRILHTPYRLLNDLARMLRQEAAQDGDDAQRHARLAEALASVQEIESLVRGTEPTSSNLAAALIRLQDQFVDLPLIMNVEDASLGLPPMVVYRIREAVRSALQNVRLYAGAGEVVVYAMTDRESWLVSVHDDGRGIGQGAEQGVGTRDLMIGALGEIGATVTIHSAPGQGTFVEFSGG